MKLPAASHGVRERCCGSIAREKNPQLIDRSLVLKHFGILYLMNTKLKILLLILAVVLLTNTVISDRLIVELNPNDNKIDLHYGSNVTPVSVDSVTIDLKAITLLLCFGLVGVVVFARQRIRSKNNDKNIAP